MSFHTKRSPSQAHRFHNCKGCFAMCESLPPEQRNTAGVAAQLGTVAHAIVERCLRTGENPEDYRDRLVELVGDEQNAVILRKGAKMPKAPRVFFEVDSDIIDATEMMVTHVRDQCEELGITPDKLQLETRTNPLPDRDDTSGTADVTLDAWPVLLKLMDYKHGYLRVDVDDNEQLLAYLLGKAIETGFSHDRYEITVCQPNSPHPEGRIRTMGATKEELLAFQAKHRKAIEDCEAAEAAFAKAKHGADVNAAWAKKWLKAGDHCTFCDASPVCPARIALAQDKAKEEFSLADEPAPIQLDFNARPELVSRILQWAPFIEPLIREATFYAQRSLEAGHPVPGYKLVQLRSVRKLVDDDPKTLAKQIAKQFTIAEEKLWKKELRSGPQIQKLLPKDERADFEEDYLIKPEGRLTLATEDDPRPAVNVSAADDFADVLGEDDFG